jgi:centromere-localized protein 2
MAGEQPSPPTEESILSTFLLPPTPLSLSTSLQDFRSLFPRQYQSDPLIQLLYRELQHQVALGADEVRNNIEAEAERGRKMASMVRKGRKWREMMIYWIWERMMLLGWRFAWTMRYTSTLP